MAPPLAILSTGLVTSVGFTAAASCAAIRAKLTNTTETHFIDSSGAWIMAHSVQLEQPWRGLSKLAKMAVLAIDDCVANVKAEDWSRIPLLLCVAERERPGRTEGIDDRLFAQLQHELDIQFSTQSLIIPQGRVSIGTALKHTRRLIAEDRAPYVLIAATDSLLSWPTLSAYERSERLLTPKNSNGFIAGEGAAAILVGPADKGAHLHCMGLGFATETATIGSGRPLCGRGLAQSIKLALADAGCEMHDMDFRSTDLSGEHYYFKEAALALSRTMRARKSEFDIWHPAECIGESGAVSGLATIIAVNEACHKGYAPGHNVLCHSAVDSGQRVASIFQFRIH